MFELIGSLCVIALFAAFHRFRGGALSDWMELRGGDTNALFRFRLGTQATRVLLWVLPCAVALLLAGFHPFAVALGALGLWYGFSQGHALYQDMGRAPQVNSNGGANERLVPFPLPTYAEMTHPVMRTLIDMVGMSTVHASRFAIMAVALIVGEFLWRVVITDDIDAGNFHMSFWLFAPGLWVVLGGPAYLLGYLTPWSFGRYEAISGGARHFVNARSSEWGEVYVGALWGLAFVGVAAGIAAQFG